MRFPYSPYNERKGKGKDIVSQGSVTEEQWLWIF
jgi:hypothetical protein